MQSTFKIEESKRTIKRWLALFMVVLVVSGVATVFAEWELSIVTKFFDENSFFGGWLHEIYLGLKNTGARYPYLFYGSDRLAVGHFVLAIALVGPYKDPVKNKWVIECVATACMLIIPFALIAGYFRGIPFWWRLVDCAFGILGLIPVGICHNKIDEIERLEKQMN
jgi:hypothetical protein